MYEEFCERGNMKIFIRTTAIIITDASLSDKMKSFTGKLTVFERNSNGNVYPSWKSYIYDNVYDILILRRGINFKSLRYYFPNHEIVYDFDGNPGFNSNISIKVNPRDELQEESIEYLLSRDNYTQRYLCLKPGDGKTYCAINYICQCKKKSIIICDNDRIINQWKESFLKFTNIKEEEILLICGSNSIEKLINKSNSKFNHKVVIASHRTLYSYFNQTNKWEELNNFFNKLGIYNKIYDEAHIEWKNIFYIDCFTNVKHTIYLTATPERSNQNENNIFQFINDDIIKFSRDDSSNEDIKYINFIDFTFNSNPSKEQIINMSNNHGFDSNRYNDYLISDNYIKTYFNILYEFIKQFKYKDKKIAIVFNCNNSILKFMEFLINEKKIDKESIGIFCGLTDKKKRNDELEKQIILTTLKGFNKGIDVKNLSFLVNTVSISSKVILEQLSGRLRYENGIKKFFLQMCDEGFPQCKNHMKIRDKIISEIANKFFILDSNDFLSNEN